MTKEGFTKIINFMTPGAGVPLLERGENVIIIVKIPLPPSQPCLSLGRHWFSRGDNFQCYPLVQSIFNSVLQYRLRSTTPLHSTPLQSALHQSAETWWGTNRSRYAEWAWYMFIHIQLKFSLNKTLYFDIFIIHVWMTS